MRAVFWSCVPGQTGVTAGMLAAGFAAALFFGQSVYFQRADPWSDGLEEELISGRTAREELKGVGLPAACKAMRAGTLNTEMFHNCAVNLPGSRIAFLPGSLREEATGTKEEKNRLSEKLVRLASSEYDVTLIETRTGWDGLKEAWIKEADWVVVCLSQNRRVLDRYFAEKREMPKNCRYLIGMYRPESDMTLKNLARLYPELGGKVCLLPWCTQYQDACSRGDTLRFFRQYAKTGKGEPNREFIRECRRLSEMILSGKGRG